MTASSAQPPNGVEALKAALWRSRWIFLAALVVGAGALNGLAWLSGPRYAATAKVLLSSQDLGAALTHSAPPFTDQERTQETERQLARSPELYQRLARREPALGGWQGLSAAIALDGDTSSNILPFTATAKDGNRAIAVANAVASEFVDWRATVAAAPIERAIARVQGRIAAGETDPALRANLRTLHELEALAAGNATLVAPAATATKTRPAPVRDSALGLALGLVVGLLVMGVREALDTTVRSEADVEALLGLPVLASVGRLPRGVRLASLGRHRDAFEDGYALLAADLEERRAAADSTVLAITSATANEGKSTTAANLAVVLARRGARCALVDFDLRRPSLGEIFRIPETPLGTGQVATGAASLAQALWTVPFEDIDSGTRDLAIAAATRTKVGTLQVLPAGRAVSPQAALRSQALAAMLAELRDHFDWILVDTPPALRAVEMAELSRHADSALVVVRQHAVSRRALRALDRQARGWRARAAGAVITDVPVQAGDARYYRSA